MDHVHIGVGSLRSQHIIHLVPTALVLLVIVVAVVVEQQRHPIPMKKHRQSGSREWDPPTS